MKINRRLTSKFAAAFVSLALLAGGSAYAQDEQDNTKTKQAQAVSKEVYDQIQKAQELVDAKDNPGALRIINRLYDPDKLTEYEQANVLNYMGFIYYNMEDVPNAIRSYERMVAIPSLEPQLLKQTTYTLAQLYTMEEQYQKALNTLDKWFVMETNPPPEPFILRAQSLYQLQRFSEMVQPIEQAMQIAETRGTPVKEDWYILLSFAYFQDENYAKVRDVHKILLENWPKKRYWFQLAGAYTELGEDQNLVAAYDAAHTQGLLEKETEFVTMAQLYLQREVPYKAATLLEQEMEAGRVSQDAKNYRLLSQAWMLSQEDGKAIPALKEAARRTNDGELDVRLGNSYLNVGDHDECATAVRNGIRKGGLKNPDHAQVSLGMCLYNLKDYNDARAAFREAAKVPRSRRVANQWISVIDAEVQRNEAIRSARQAAEKKRQEVEARRAKSGRAP
ncbi:MAG: hypothetical protein AAGE85_07665 [Pseudomonadota bacterium]